MVSTALKSVVKRYNQEQPRLVAALADAGLLIAGGFLAIAGIQMAATRLTSPFFYFYVSLIPLGALAAMKFQNHITLVGVRFLYSLATSIFLFLLWQPHYYYEAIVFSLLIALSTTLALQLDLVIRIETSGSDKAHQATELSTSATPPPQHVRTRGTKEKKLATEVTPATETAKAVFKESNLLSTAYRRALAIGLVITPLTFCVLSALRVLPAGLGASVLALASFGQTVIPSLELASSESKDISRDFSGKTLRSTAILGLSIIIGELVTRYIAVV
jgi:hypothetical protein